MNIKINITFVDMRGLRKIAIKSFLLLAVSLCFGINSYSYSNLRDINSEILTCTCNVENSFSLNTDNLSDDQIDQSDNSGLSVEQHGLISQRQANFQIHTLCFTVWQPPKIS